MGSVNIQCCNQNYYSHGTNRGQSGIIRCSKCGCSYGWMDLGSGKIRSWTEQPCSGHSFGDERRVSKCEYCNGKGTEYNGDVCRTCFGSGLRRI